MKKYNRLSHSVWYCKYHVIFCPKYRHKVLVGKTEVFVRNQIYKLCGYKDQVNIEEINIIISIPPKYSVSGMMGYLKGKLALRLFENRKDLTKKYWGKHFWSRGYCVSSVGLDEAQIKRYVKWQQEREQKG